MKHLSSLVAVTDMNDPNIIQEKDYRYEAYKPLGADDGFSGALMLATKLTDASVQYVVKSKLDSVTVSEFVYHKVASALGLYTQEVKLIKRFLESRNACAVRYCPGARLVSDFDAENPDRADYFRFRALYLILDEDDSEEFYADGDNRVFKLDNAEAFKLFSGAGLLSQKAKTKEPMD
jgi:hypothetical protein